MPEITGEIASGRSMSVMRMLLPRNSNLAIAHAAARPNTVLIGTTTSAVVSVRRIAAAVSGSAKLCRYAATPWANAMANTVASGASSTAARKVSDTVMNSQRTMACIQVCCPGRAVSPARPPWGRAAAISAPPARGGGAPNPAAG